MKPIITKSLQVQPSASETFSEKNAGIKFAVGESSLGSILVACGDQGVLAILLGDDPGELVRDLQAQLPETQLTGEDPVCRNYVSQVAAFIEAPRKDLDLPLAPRGTAFQLGVWQAIRAIPVGTTLSYAEVAQRIGEPNAARAVSQACAENAIAIAIPCHRVVRGDGALSGYRGGLDRKRALLSKEVSA
jgi:AraC family transcriptional regulator, regulatory protein of adaptative response / methylated-DNA-[protein]-cysteine methyltransferase